MSMNTVKLDVPELRLRWTVGGQKRPDKRPDRKERISKLELGQWILSYCDHKGKYYLGLHLESDVRPDPFHVSVQLDGTGRIATELSEETRCTYDNRDHEANKNYLWFIWERSASDIERSYPEFCPDAPLRFLVVIGDGRATPTALKSTQTEDTHTTIPACLQSLSEDLCQYMEQDADTDVEFQCGGVSTRAHAAVVCARSPVVASMLSSDMVEGRTRVVKIPNMEVDIFRHFLKYIYTGKLPELTEDIAMQLYEGGDQYAVLGLARRCSKYLLEHLSIHNACDVLLVAEAHSDGGFVERVVEYMVENKVPQVSDRWPAFCDDHPRLALRVFNSLMKKGLK